VSKFGYDGDLMRDEIEYKDAIKVWWNICDALAAELME